jgi:hypothetical protein
MRYGHEVLDHFLFRGEFFGIQCQQMASALFTQMPEKINPELAQAIVVSDDQGSYLVNINPIHKSQELRPLEV